MVQKTLLREKSSTSLENLRRWLMLVVILIATFMAALGVIFAALVASGVSYVQAAGVSFLVIAVVSMSLLWVVSLFPRTLEKE
jgi:hypothetical protein